ncbi:hypothetical protein [Streptomyces sp. CA-111067]|uniref:hypothetical protein n=1 Tax=Streptomyces sp. CA-111067 TaxID=3240046 RepID=UPI003D976AAE
MGEAGSNALRSVAASRVAGSLSEYRAAVRKPWKTARLDRREVAWLLEDRGVLGELAEHFGFPRVDRPQQRPLQQAEILHAREHMQPHRLRIGADGRDQLVHRGDGRHSTRQRDSGHRREVHRGAGA